MELRRPVREPCVVVCHPGRQHSHQLARSLHEKGLLYQYWTGMPRSRKAGAGRVLETIGVKTSFADVALPDQLVRMQPWAALLYRGSRYQSSFNVEKPLQYWGDYLADRIYASWLKRECGRAGPDAIIAYENAALMTFRTGKAAGITTILDAASVHHATADAWLGKQSWSTFEQQVRRRKDMEVELADHVFVLSELARQSYLSAGVSDDKITVMGLGVDAGTFHGQRHQRAPEAEAPRRFIFVGHSSIVKGADILADAATDLWRSGDRFEIAIAGEISRSVFERVPKECLLLLGKLSQEQLAREMLRADCAISASRCDGYGLAVVEAMACGTPVIVSDHTGVRDLIRPGINGWVIPTADSHALAERMHWCILNRQSLGDMRAATRSVGLENSWEKYRPRVASCIAEIITQKSSTGRLN